MRRGIDRLARWRDRDPVDVAILEVGDRVTLALLQSELRLRGIPFVVDDNAGGGGFAHPEITFVSGIHVHVPEERMGEATIVLDEIRESGEHALDPVEE